MSSKRKKILLMGKSGSGKTSMRAIIFKSQNAADTRRLAATIDVESSQIKFLGGLRLDLWDCGGQDSFMDSHLTSQSSTIFRSVYALIYIFDVESPELLSSDTHYFIKCLKALRDQNQQNAPIAGMSNGKAAAAAEDAGPLVFVLLHKMDLVPADLQEGRLRDFEGEVSKRATEAGFKGQLVFFGSSIWNESLYKAWSTIISQLMPSLASLKEQLTNFLNCTSAAEVVLFERTTFLVVSSVTAPQYDQSLVQNGDSSLGVAWDKKRYERISTMVKAFKLGCSKIRTPFNSLMLCTTEYTAVLDVLTPETYILVLAPCEIQPAAIQLQIRLARPQFERVETIGR